MPALGLLLLFLVCAESAKPCLGITAEVKDGECLKDSLIVRKANCPGWPRPLLHVSMMKPLEISRSG